MPIGLVQLLSEVDCRIEHGSNDNGHLNYIRNQLVGILYGKDQMLSTLELVKQIKKRDSHIGKATASESLKIAKSKEENGDMPF